MLAGLLFAMHDADDRPDRLTATLPVGGSTLIEHQARQLIAAGAAQIVVVAQRLSPELMGALNRVGRRGVAVDPVRNAREAAEKLHPLARVVMMADGLVTTDGTVHALAREGGDALLVVRGTDAPTTFERVGGGMAWAGIARLSPARVAEVASLPRDYDPQSALLRVAEAAQATHLLLPDAVLRDGHGIEHSGLALDARGRRLIAASVTDRRNWFERLVVGSLARVAVPPLVARGLSGAVIALGAGGLAGVGGVLLWAGWAKLGLMLAVAATLLFTVGALLSGLRDEPEVARAQAIGAALVPAGAALLLAHGRAVAIGDSGPTVTALALIAIAALGERAMRWRGAWWGSPPAYLLLLAISAWFGWPVAGLTLAAVYAFATAAAAIETLREQP